MQTRLQDDLLGISGKLYQSDEEKLENFYFF